ncbi:hypothetical protein RCL1_002215 [Eukaryota sp. TZLM3-RCL]
MSSLDCSTVQSPWEPVNSAPSYKDILSVIIGTFLLLPLRLVVFFALAISCSCAMRINGLERHIKSPNRTKLIERNKSIISFHLRLILWSLGFSGITVEGEYKGKTEARAYVSNHSSWIDCFVLAVFIYPSYIAKAEVQRIPLVGHALKAWLCLAIDRGSISDRQRIKQQVVQRMSDATLPPLVVFPEGCTNNGCFLTKFQTGPFGGDPIQPIIIKYGGKFLPIGEGTPMWYSLFRMMVQFKSSVNVTFLPVYHPYGEELQDSRLLATNVRRYMARIGSLKISDQGFKEKCIWNEYNRGIKLVSKIKD